MFSHIMVGANDIQASKTFYDAILGSLGYEPGKFLTDERFLYATDTGIFVVTVPINGESATCGNGTTIGFSASSPELVNAWHSTGIANGGVSIEDPPGPRELAGLKFYAAYLRDPAGNKLCALHWLA